VKAGVQFLVGVRRAERRVGGPFHRFATEHYLKCQNNWTPAFAGEQLL